MFRWRYAPVRWAYSFFIAKLREKDFFQNECPEVSLNLIQCFAYIAKFCFPARVICTQ